MKKDFDNSDRDGGSGEGIGASKRTSGGASMLTALLDQCLAKLTATGLPRSFGHNATVEQLAKAIQRVVGDPLLELTPCLRVAKAIQEGDYPESSLNRVIACMRKRQQDGTLLRPAFFFIGAMRRSFREHGLSWPQAEHPRHQR